MQRRTLITRAAKLVLAAILGTLLAGCASSVGMGGGGSSSFVSTSIQNSSRNRVDRAVKTVFRNEGFTLLSQTANEYDFRKWGNRAAEIKYGSWFTEGVAVEPEVVVFDKGNGNFTVHCDVYMREHNGSSLLDANHKVLLSGKAAYNGLMHDIKRMAEAN